MLALHTCMSFIVFKKILNEPHRWCNGNHARLQCDRSWVQDRQGQTNDYKIGICCFSAKHTALRRKDKDWKARN
jgi:hypothetical protein